MKKWGMALFILCSVIWASCVRTDGFSPSHITAPLLTKTSSPVTAEIRQMLSQPYHYLGKGRQCFVFESADGRYVLKFFNQKYLHLPWYSVFTGSKELQKRTLRRQFYENSYEIAQREFGDEIVYLHLSPSEPLPNVDITDKAGKTYALNLNQLPFVLQKKGQPFYPTLEAIYEKEGLDGLYREIDRFLATIDHRISKNIADWDRNVKDNWGYVDGHLFHLDPGRLYYDDFSDPAHRREEWQRATQSFHKWLSKHYPPAAAYLTSHLPLSDSN